MRTPAPFAAEEKSLYISFIWTSRRWGGGDSVLAICRIWKEKYFVIGSKEAVRASQSIGKAEKEIKSAAVLFLAPSVVSEGI